MEDSSDPLLDMLSLFLAHSFAVATSPSSSTTLAVTSPIYSSTGNPPVSTRNSPHPLLSSKWCNFSCSLSSALPPVCVRYRAPPQLCSWRPYFTCTTLETPPRVRGCPPFVRNHLLHASVFGLLSALGLSQQFNSSKVESWSYDSSGINSTYSSVMTLIQ